MYLYVYDEGLQDRRFERDIAQIETRLTDLGIAGSIIRLAFFRDYLKTIRNEISKGDISTVVAVGNDETFAKVLEAVGDSKVVIGYLPVSGKNAMAALLGIQSGIDACPLLSARLVQNLDLGEVNGHRFLHHVSCGAIKFKASCDDLYTLETIDKAKLDIVNLSVLPEHKAASAVDGRLTMFAAVGRGFIRKTVCTTMVPIRFMTVNLLGPTKFVVDSTEMEFSKLELRVIPGALRIITGKDRKF